MRRRWAPGWLLAMLLAMWLLVAAPAAAQEVDPGAIVGAYAAAFNAHDPAAALALFDQYGSATDARGHHFEGQTGLTEFLLASGFGNPETRLSTASLYVVGNRALWTYTCSCAAADVDVRVVVNHGKIVVFAISPAGPAMVRPAARTDAGLLGWLVGLLAIVAVLAAAGGLHAPGAGAPAARANANQGHLLAALRQASEQRRRLAAANLASYAPAAERSWRRSR